MRRLWLAALMMLAGCAPGAPTSGTPTADNASASSDDAVSIPGPDAAIGAGLLPMPELDGVVAAAGGWVRDRDAAGDAAVFRDPAGHILFAMRCVRAQRRWLFVSAAPIGRGDRLKIITGSGASTYPVTPRAFAPGSMASTPIDDPFVTIALAKATGRVGVVLGAGKPLAMPVDTVIAQVIGTCLEAHEAQSS